VLLSLLSLDANACFSPPEGLYDEHVTLFFSDLGLAILASIVSIVLSVYINKYRFWVPILALVSFGYYPFYMFQLSKFGYDDYGGSCGIPGQVEAGKILLIGTSIILLYEVFVFLFIKYRDKNAI
jgi:hypothetical protein